MPSKVREDLGKVLRDCALEATSWSVLTMFQYRKGPTVMQVAQEDIFTVVVGGGRLPLSASRQNRKSALTPEK